nr:unnamed protein product [Callosobruchus chinensis]
MQVGTNLLINVFLLAVPILYILLTVPQILPWEQAELSFLAWCHIAGILCPWVGSFLYHLFMNLRRGPRTYYFLLQVDMLGIWVSQSFGAMPMIFATTYCLPNHIKTFLITCYCLFSIWGLYKALIAWSPWERRLCFLLPFVMRILVWFLRLSKLGGGDPAALVHVILQDVVSITGGAIGALHIPEKWFPGAVDMYLNSHNIMHVMVVAAVYSMHTATMRDLAWMSRVKCISV